MTEGLPAACAELNTVMINVICLEAHRTASSPRIIMGAWAALLGAPKHQTPCHRRRERPLLALLHTASQVNGYTDAVALLNDLLKAQWLPGDRGYDADWFKDAFQARDIKPCIPGRRSRNDRSYTTSATTDAVAVSRSCLDA